MEYIYVLAGIVAGFISGAWFACVRVRQGAAPNLRTVIARDGGSGEEQ